MAFFSVVHSAVAEDGRQEITVVKTIRVGLWIMSKSAQDPSMYVTDLRLDDSENPLVRGCPISENNAKWPFGGGLLRI